MADESFYLIRFEQSGDAAGQLSDNSSLAFLHYSNIDSDLRYFDAVFAELIFGAMKQLRRFQQRF